MKKDGRFWILVGALVVVGGLFLAFLWSVMAAPGEPTTVQPAGNSTVTVEPVANRATPAPAPVPDPSGDKPVDADASQIENVPPTLRLSPPPQAEDVLRQAREATERARAEADRAAARARAEAARARERARARARQRAVLDDKPPMDDKPPEGW